MIWWLLGGFGTLGVVAVGAGWWLAGRPEAGVHAAPRGSDNEDLDRPGSPGSQKAEAGPVQPRSRTLGSTTWTAHDYTLNITSEAPKHWPTGEAPVPGRVRLVLDGAAQLVAVAGLVLQDTP